MLKNLAFNPRSQRWSFRVTRCQRSKTARSAFRRSKIEKNRNGAPFSNHPRCRLFGRGDPLQRLGALMGRELARPAEADAALLGALAALARPGADQVALELGQATEDGEQERQTVEVGDDQNVAGQEKPATRAISDSPAVRSAYKERETLPVAGRCRLHGGARGSGAPAGERNGQYRHGERTKGAIAERRKFSALLKLLRAGLI